MLRPISSALAVTTPASDRPDEMLRLIAVSTDWPGPAGVVRPSLDFATQDYLSLASQPAIRAASADPRMSGNAVATFEARLASFLQLPSAAIFPSGTQAIRQTLDTLLRPGDDVIVDAAADPAMFETVLQANANLHRAPSASVQGVERRLARLARRAHRGQLFIAVPAVSAYGSRIADLAELTQLARHYGAILVVDATHDLGAMGPAGGGVLEILGCAGRADIVLGSLAPTFASQAGFAAFRNPAHRAAVARAAAEAPGQTLDANALHTALDLIASPEGHRRRRNLHRLGLRLRNHLMSDGIRVMGQASPFVPLLLPVLSALPRTALLESAGPRVTLLQAPVVPLHAPRWRIQLTAAHSPADIDDLAELIRDVSRAFDRRPTRTSVPA
jgi:7-keto-8-aminopelargonate synthetase-like enzyme